MLRIAGQTAGPIGRKFFVDTHGWPEYRLKISEIFFNFFFNFFPRGMPGPSASNTYLSPPTIPFIYS